MVTVCHREEKQDCPSVSSQVLISVCSKYIHSVAEMAHDSAIFYDRKTNANVWQSLQPNEATNEHILKLGERLCNALSYKKKSQQYSVFLYLLSTTQGVSDMTNPPDLTGIGPLNRGYLLL